MSKKKNVTTSEDNDRFFAELHELNCQLVKGWCDAGPSHEFVTLIGDLMDRILEWQTVTSTPRSKRR